MSRDFWIPRSQVRCLLSNEIRVINYLPSPSFSLDVLLSFSLSFHLDRERSAGISPRDTLEDILDSCMRLWDAIGAPSHSLSHPPSPSLWEDLPVDTRLYIVSSISKVESAIGFWKYVDILDKEGSID